MNKNMEYSIHRILHIPLILNGKGDEFFLLFRNSCILYYLSFLPKREKLTYLLG